MATIPRPRFLTFVAAVLQEIGRREGDGSDALRDMWLPVSGEGISSPAGEAPEAGGQDPSSRLSAAGASGGLAGALSNSLATVESIIDEMRSVKDSIAALNNEQHQLRQTVVQQSAKVCWKSWIFDPWRKKAATLLLICFLIFPLLRIIQVEALSSSYSQLAATVASLTRRHQTTDA